MPMSPGETTPAPNESAELPQDELTLNDPLLLDQTGLPSGVEWQEEDQPLPTKFANEEEEILFGDPQGLGASRPSVDVESRSVPAKLARRLPALKRAASAPGAPPALRAAYRLLADRLENELRG